jgi:Uma2 family endonuclease
MSEAKLQASWTWEAYLEWEADQPIRYELVDGQVHAMGGGTAEHDTIGNNLRAALHAQIRGKPCRPHGPDLKVRARSLTAVRAFPARCMHRSRSRCSRSCPRAPDGSTKA